MAGVAVKSRFWGVGSFIYYSLYIFKNRYFLGYVSVHFSKKQLSLGVCFSTANFFWKRKKGHTLKCCSTKVVSKKGC